MNEFVVSSEHPSSSISLLTPKQSEFDIEVESQLQLLGYKTSIDTKYNPNASADRIMMIGPMGHFNHQLKSIIDNKNTAPPVTFWFTEQIPFDNFPFHKATSLLRAHLEQFSDIFYNAPGNRFRRIGELLLLNKHTDLTVHTFSDTNTQFMKELGINAHTTPWGYYSELGNLQEGSYENRPNDSIFIGNTLPPRGKYISDLAATLQNRNITLDIYDGMTHKPAIYGQERSQVLNNTKIMLAMPMRPWDDIHFRMLLAGANGNLVISPELADSSRGPFVPNEDFVMVPEQDIPDAIEEYLEKTDVSARIASNLHSKVMSLNMKDLVKRVVTT